MQLKSSIFLFIFLSSLFSSPAFCDDKIVLTLEKAQELTLSQNKHLLATKQLLEKARQGRLETWSEWFPKLEGSFQSYYTQKPNSPSNARSSFLSQLSMTQTLFSIEKIHAVRIATLYEDQLKLLVDAAINDVLLDVRTAYYKVVYDKETLYTAEEKVKLLVELARKMEYNYNIGLATQYNVNQSKVAIASAQQVYYGVMKQYKVDLDLLATFLGYDPGTVQLDVTENEIPVASINELKGKLDLSEQVFQSYTTTGPLLKDPYVPLQGIAMKNLFSSEEMHEWIKTAKAYRPDLKASQVAVDIAKETVRLKQGTYYPSVNFKGNYGGTPTPFAFNATPHFGDQSMQWGVGLELKWLLFDSLGRERNISKSKAEQRSLLFDWENNMQNTLAEVRKQIFSIEKSISDFVTTTANVQLAKQTLYQSQEQLDIGYINIYDYQIAVDELIQTLNSVNASKYELISSYYGLRHASGIDLKDKE